MRGHHGQGQGHGNGNGGGGARGGGGGGGGGTAVLDRPIATVPAAGHLAGPIRTRNAWNGGDFGVPWENINRWDAFFQQASDRYAIPFARIKGHCVIESQGEPRARQQNPQGDSFGLLQVVPRFWGNLIGDLADVDVNGWSQEAIGALMMDNPRVAVLAGTAVLRSNFDQAGNWDQASSLFFLGNPTWAGGDFVNPTDGPTYQRTLNQLIAEIDQATGPGPEPSTGVVIGGDTGPEPGATGAGLLAEARRHLGKPYVWATAGPDSFDCSGLIHYCFRRATGQDLAQEFRDSHRQFQWGDPVQPTQARPGDLVFYDTADGSEWRLGNNASHVGIYAGNNDLLNALRPGVGVVLSDLGQPYWAQRWIGTRRVLPAG